MNCNKLGYICLLVTWLSLSPLNVCRVLAAEETPLGYCAYFEGKLKYNSIAWKALPGFHTRSLECGWFALKSLAGPLHEASIFYNWSEYQTDSARLSDTDEVWRMSVPANYTGKKNPSWLVGTRLDGSFYSAKAFGGRQGEETHMIDYDYNRYYVNGNQYDTKLQVVGIVPAHNFMGFGTGLHWRYYQWLLGAEYMYFVQLGQMMELKEFNNTSKIKPKDNRIWKDWIADRSSSSLQIVGLSVGYSF